ncbi:hypothetical protein [Bradyrhizobium erythrophlei]|uniref:Beta-barrel porin 2 n=1 Tax=Bradyrhizobium erythrophlei TaxID=1437360 RepID=A0A1M5TI85_9BRAD|nr:hypothetical protein [Bradyrhizobium erythrophlei]SHH50515.1 hypothetical protein SAMN05443248_5032 [Bradyrhizobium erythrophlei]
MRKTAAAASILLCLVPPAARAVDWSLRSTASETVELNNNLFLSPAPIGGTLGSYSTISANAEARTPTSKFDFDSYVNYNKYFGPGASTLPDTENLSYGFKGHYETFGKNNSDRNYLDAGYTSQSAAFALLGQLGVLTNVVGSLNTFNFGGGIDRSLSALDTVSLSARSTLTSYDPPSAGTAFTDTSANASWSHRLSSLTSITASSNAEWLAFNNASSTNIMILRNQGGFDTSLSPLLSFHGMWGAANVQTENNGVGAVSGSATGLIYDMLLTYKALKNTTFTVAAFQSVGPTAIGSLVQTTSVRAGVSHAINSVSSVTFSADEFQTTSTTTGQFASASVSYSRTLARDWTAAITYRYLHSFGTTGGTVAITPIIGGLPVVSTIGAASSNSIVVVVSKSTTLLAHTE